LSTGALQHDRCVKSRGEKSSFCHDADMEAASPAITHAPTTAADCGRHFLKFEFVADLNAQTDGAA
jgi:hypothetical protein